MVPGMDNLTWTKSTYSADSANCVEVAVAGGQLLVRDSKDPDGGYLAFSHGTWSMFVDDIKNSRFSQ